MTASLKEEKNRLQFEQLIEKALQDFPTDFAKPEEIEQMKRAIIQSFSKGTYVLSELGFSRGMIDALYAVGTEYYTAEKYEEAQGVFTVMASIDPTNFRASFGLGLCCHKLQQYAEALLYYWVARFLRMDDPLILYYAADCLFHLHHAEDALILLSEAYLISLETGENREIGERAMRWYVHVMERRQSKTKKRKKKENK